MRANEHDRNLSNSKKRVGFPEEKAKVIKSLADAHR